MKPDPRSLAYLKPRNSAGIVATSLAVAVTLTGVMLSLSGIWWVWAIGQITLAIALLQWFALQHEAGHQTLFASSLANSAVGYLASVWTVIPFSNWSRIHARHHRYTGWQDLDATTALLVPRQLKTFERLTINTAWALWLPLFSLLYRLQNFWNAPRIGRYLSNQSAASTNCKKSVWLDVAALFVVYIALFYLFGWQLIATTIGPALILSLAAQDVILLSQHTHMPCHNSASTHSNGEAPLLFSPLEQEHFTRSMRLPNWLARLMLNFDRHELHHMYVRVPGYDLHRIDYKPDNEVDWLEWLRSAKQLSAVQFLFGRREDTGLMK